MLLQISSGQHVPTAYPAGLSRGLADAQETYPSFPLPGAHGRSEDRASNKGDGYSGDHNSVPWVLSTLIRAFHEGTRSAASTAL